MVNIKIIQQSVSRPPELGDVYLAPHSLATNKYRIVVQCGDAKSILAVDSAKFVLCATEIQLLDRILRGTYVYVGKVHEIIVMEEVKKYI